MKKRSQKGAAVVEFALILPILLLLLFGIIEFSFYMYDKAMLTNACREGARAGIVFVPDRGDMIGDDGITSIDKVEQRIYDATRRYLYQKEIIDNVEKEKFMLLCADNELIKDKNIFYEWKDGDDTNNTPYDSGDVLTVRLDYTFRFIFFSKVADLFGGGFGDIPLRAVAVMRLE